MKSGGFWSGVISVAGKIVGTDPNLAAAVILAALLTFGGIAGLNLLTLVLCFTILYVLYSLSKIAFGIFDVWQSKVTLRTKSDEAIQQLAALRAQLRCEESHETPAISPPNPQVMVTQKTRPVRKAARGEKK